MQTKKKTKIKQKIIVNYVFITLKWVELFKWIDMNRKENRIKLVLNKWYHCVALIPIKMKMKLCFWFYWI